jgi:hypothetical protein
MGEGGEEGGGMVVVVVMMMMMTMIERGTLEGVGIRGND